jgi:hypothetical protein
MFRWLCFLILGISSVARADLFAAFVEPGAHDRFPLRFSAPSDVKRLQLCEPNVRWGCNGGDAKFYEVPSEPGPAGRGWFRTRLGVLLWDGKELHFRLVHANGSTTRAVLKVSQKMQLFTGDLTHPFTGDAQPNPAVVGSACVFAVSPVPAPGPGGERGTTYASHRTSRDYALRDNTPLYSMGTCETVKRIDTADEHPCGIGIALRCRLKGEVMGVLYCHLSRPAEAKRFFGIGELVGYSGHTGTSNPHLHLGLTFDVWDHTKPKPADAEDEELLMPGLPVPKNNPDRWLRENGCYKDPRPTRGEREPVRYQAREHSQSDWDGLAHQANAMWSWASLP